MGPLRNTLRVYVKFIRKERHIKNWNESFFVAYRACPGAGQPYRQAGLQCENDFMSRLGGDTHTYTHRHTHIHTLKIFLPPAEQKIVRAMQKIVAENTKNRSRKHRF